MRGYNYHFAIDPKNASIIKIRPTKGTYAKAFGPTLVVWGAVMLIGAAIQAKEKRELNKLDNNPKQK